MRMRRAISLTGVGCLAVGPLLTVWFDFLEKIVPGRSKRAILKRTVLDQAIEVPVMISIIFSLSSLAEGHSPSYCLAKIQLKLLSTWKDCTAVWFPVQLVNQGLIVAVPGHLPGRRVLLLGHLLVDRVPLGRGLGPQALSRGSESRSGGRTQD